MKIKYHTVPDCVSIDKYLVNRRLGIDLSENESLGSCTCIYEAGFQILEISDFQFLRETRSRFHAWSLCARIEKNLVYRKLRIDDLKPLNNVKLVHLKPDEKISDSSDL